MKRLFGLLALTITIMAAPAALAQPATGSTPRSTYHVLGKLQVDSVPYRASTDDSVLVCKGGVFYKSISTGGGGTSATAPFTHVPCMLMIGESNVGGQGGLNSLLTSGQLAVRPHVQIWYPPVGGFQPLHIGVNNLYDHFGIPVDTVHGAENGFATFVEAGGLIYDTLKVLKVGQGGSSLEEWLTNFDGGNYWQKASTRIDSFTAKMYALHQVPDWGVFISIGVNDAIANNTPAFGYSPTPDVMKGLYKTFIQNIRRKVGMAPVFMTKLMVAPQYSIKIGEIATELPHCYAIETSGLTQHDFFHWDYAGLDSIGRRTMRSYVANAGQDEFYAKAQIEATQDYYWRLDSTMKSRGAIYVSNDSLHWQNGPDDYSTAAGISLNDPTAVTWGYMYDMVRTRPYGLYRGYLLSSGYGPWARSVQTFSAGDTLNFQLNPSAALADFNEIFVGFTSATSPSAISDFTFSAYLSSGSFYNYGSVCGFAGTGLVYAVGDYMQIIYTTAPSVIIRRSVDRVTWTAATLAGTPSGAYYAAVTTNSATGPSIVNIKKTQ